VTTCSIDNIHGGHPPKAPFDNAWWLEQGTALGKACDIFSESISYCVIDDEMWIWDHSEETIFKLNPTATTIVFDRLAGRALDPAAQAFLDESLRGVVRSSIGVFDEAPKANTDDNYYAFRFLRLLAMNRHVPLFPALELTYLCNYDCIHCYRPQESAEEMDLDRWKGLVTELKAEGTLGVVLTGGEVTAWSHIKEFITFLRSIRMAFVVKTNGHLVDKYLARFLAENHCHEVHISLYGSDPDSNDYVTQRVGSFDRIVNAIRLCAEVGLKVRISSSLTERTFSHYKQIVDLANEMGVGLNIDPMLSPSASSRIDAKAIRITHEQVQDFCDGLGGTLALDFQTLHPPGSPVCSAARSNCSIAPSGNVYPCVGYWYKEKTLSVLTLPFREVWTTSPILNTVRGITNEKLPTCSACQFREFCPRCLGAGYEETGELFGISPNNCAVAEGLHRNYKSRSPSLTKIGLSGSFGNRCS